MRFRAGPSSKASTSASGRRQLLANVGRQVVVLQPRQDVARLARGLEETLAQRAVAQHQRLPGRPLHGQRCARAAIAPPCDSAMRLGRAVAALRHQGVEREQRAQRGRAQQRADQQERHQQQLRERETAASSGPPQPRCALRRGG